MKIENTVSYQLARVTTAFRNSLERSMGEIGLHGGQVFVLFELWKRDGQKQIDLAVKLNLTAPTVNKMIKGMIDDKLVTRARIEDDARSTRIFLTEHGREIRAQLETQWHELEEYNVTGLTEAERLILFELLSKLKNMYSGWEADEE